MTLAKNLEVQQKKCSDVKFESSHIKNTVGKRIKNCFAPYWTSLVYSLLLNLLSFALSHTHTQKLMYNDEGKTIITIKCCS